MSGRALGTEFLRASGYFSFLSLMGLAGRSPEAIRFLIARIANDEENVFSHCHHDKPKALNLLFLGSAGPYNPGAVDQMKEVILKAFDMDFTRLSFFSNFIRLFNESFPDNKIDMTSSSVTSVSGGASGAASAVVQEEVPEEEVPEEVPEEDVTAGPVASSPGGAAASVAESRAGSSVGVSAGAGYGIAGGGSAGAGGAGGAPTSARTMLSSRICELLNSWVNVTQIKVHIGTGFSRMTGGPTRAVWPPAPRAMFGSPTGIAGGGSAGASGAGVTAWAAPRPVLWGAAASGGGGKRVLFEEIPSGSSSELSFALASPISDGSDNASVQLFKSVLAQEFPGLGKESVVATVKSGQTSLRLSIPATSSVGVLETLQKLVSEGKKLEITATETIQAKC